MRKERQVPHNTIITWTTRRRIARRVSRMGPRAEIVVSYEQHLSTDYSQPARPLIPGVALSISTVGGGVDDSPRSDSRPAFENRRIGCSVASLTGALRSASTGERRTVWNAHSDRPS
jgi:hypothetical protein